MPSALPCWHWARSTARNYRRSSSVAATGLPSRASVCRQLAIQYARAMTCIDCAGCDDGQAGPGALLRGEVVVEANADHAIARVLELTGGAHAVRVTAPSPVA